jgi:hypothetical protein
VGETTGGRGELVALPVAEGGGGAGCFAVEEERSEGERG